MHVAFKMWLELLVLFYLAASSGAIKSGSESTLYVSLGESAILKCCVDPNTEEYDGFFNADEKQISNLDGIENYEFTETIVSENKKCHNLTIKQMSAELVGEYICKTKKNDVIIFRLFLDASIDSVKSPQILTNKNNTIHISVHGKPFPSIDWIRYVDGEDKPIAKYDSQKKEMTLGKESYRISQINGSLKIANPTRYDQGMYHVFVHKKMSKIQKSIEVRVEEATKIIIDQTAFIAMKGPKKVIQCTAYGNPLPNITFITLSKEQLTKFERKKLNKTIIQAKIDVLTNDSYLDCMASNKLGSDYIRIDISDSATMQDAAIHPKLAFAIGIIIAVVLCGTLISCVTYFIRSLKQQKTTTDTEADFFEDLVKEKKRTKTDQDKGRSRKKVIPDVNNADVKDVYMWLKSEKTNQKALPVRAKKKRTNPSKEKTDDVQNREKSSDKNTRKRTRDNSEIKTKQDEAGMKKSKKRKKLSPPVEENMARKKKSKDIK